MLNFLRLHVFIIDEEKEVLLKAHFTSEQYYNHL